MGGHIAARSPNVAYHSIFSGLQKRSGNMFKSEISSNLSQDHSKMLVLRIT